MSVTRFPNGIEAGLAAGGTVQFAAGSAVLSNAGTVDVSTGLTSVLYAQATPAGALSSTAGTVGGYTNVTATVKAAGTLMLKGYDQMGTASAVAGTAYWFAIGT